MWRQWFLTAPERAKTKVQSVSAKTKSVTTLNYDKLYYAVAMAESGNCDTAWHKATNNCVSIMRKGKLVKYASVAENKAAFISLWKRVYGGKFPTAKEAKKYTGNDKPVSWLRNVTYYYGTEKR